MSDIPPHLEHFEIRYLEVSGDKTRINRNGYNVSHALRQEIGLKGVHSTHWGGCVSDAISATFATSPHFWDHLQVHSREIWNMEQTVRRVLKKDAKNFTSNNKQGLESAIKNKGSNFDRKFSYIYNDWLKRFHSYIQEPSNAIFNTLIIPTETSKWFVTVQLYPRIFYEDQEKHILWRKGGMKMEQLKWDPTTSEWIRTEENYKNAKTVEIAWYCSGDAPGVYELKDDKIVKK